MFAHDELELPENLLPDDVSDLLARLGHRCDRRNVTRALEDAGIPGVVPPASRATRWTIPRRALLDVVAAVLQRRQARAAGPGRRPVAPLAAFRLPAAHLLLRERALVPLVPRAIRREIAAERRRAEAAAAERRRRRLEAAEAGRREEELRRRRAEAYRLKSAMPFAYAECRLAASAARFPVYSEGLYDTPAFAAFLEAWPLPDHRPSWWRPPPGMLEQVEARLTPWLAGKVRQPPDFRALVPTGIDFAQPWPWRADDDRGDPYPGYVAVARQPAPDTLWPSRVWIINRSSALTVGSTPTCRRSDYRAGLMAVRVATIEKRGDVWVAFHNPPDFGGYGEPRSSHPVNPESR